ncbi:hypothetical protein HaLaN_29715 [Haematococcus lacustris]|uniref:Uncharacterized protein n=1 Tax=Haematococcus lacustris TaxID=44745 RepID=A0A6A0ADP8_HAELA|nr:hypothetical protein HaLaN_29715 [Haematococcus lacustris]
MAHVISPGHTDPFFTHLPGVLLGGVSNRSSRAPHFSKDRTSIRDSPRVGPRVGQPYPQDNASKVDDCRFIVFICSWLSHSTWATQFG